MAATIIIVSCHGATVSTTETTVSGSTLRFKVADDSTVDANNPVPIPAAGTNYSYVKQLRLKCTVAPSTLVNNVKFYTDGSGWTGATGVGLIGKTYASGSYLVGTTQGTTQITASSNAFTWTSGSPLTVAGSTSTTTTFSDIVCLQLSVANTSSPGTTTGETLTFAYDES